MALSGMITFGLLVVLIGCLNGQPTHPLSLLMKARGRTARIQCKESTLQSNALHWYRLKDQAFQRLMYFEAGSTKAKSDPGVPSRYAGSVNGDVVTLTISTLELSDAGSYYCALWSGDRKVFGSGTRLYVTDPKSDTVKTPKLTGYLPSKKSPDNHGKQTMLCHASDMFPDLVTFKWQEKSVGGEWTDASKENVVEQRKESKPVTVTSMIIVDKNMAENKDFKCIVTHEGSTGDPQILEMKEENSKPAKESEGDDQNTVACTPSAEEPLTKQISGDSEQIPSMFLFVYAYGVLLMKNGLFFCVVSIFLLKSKAGKKDESS